MKKKILALMVALLLTVSSTAIAQDDTQQTLIKHVRGLLTEVYGYTQEEAEAFTVEITQEDDRWTARFYNHPGWEYSAFFSLTDLRYMNAVSPFTAGKSTGAPENSVRSILRAMKENGWLSTWDAQSRAALGAALKDDGNIYMDIELRDGLEDAAYAPAQALQDFFTSCYHDEIRWQPALVEWRDQVFAEFGLEKVPVITVVESGVHTRKTNDTKQITEFVGEVPGELETAFSHPKLQGWQCLAGAYRVKPYEDVQTLYGAGLAAFAKDGQRMLVMLYQLHETKAWQVAPVGGKALLSERALYITYTNGNGFEIHYPISDVAKESFQVSLDMMHDVSAPIVQCILSNYSFVDYETRQSIEIRGMPSDNFECWYHGVSLDRGTQTIFDYPALAPPAMEYIDAEAFPKTEEACQAAAAITESIPDGYGMTSAVHLRGDTSSRAKDLGMLRLGTLVQVLDTLPGDPYSWYRVRLGDTEGYIASIYVTYPDSVKTSVPTTTPAVARTKKELALKQDTGMFAKTIETLPEGTLLRVLAETGNWLIVSVPQAEDDWLMRPDEMIGYVKMSDVVQAGSPIQLDWLQP